MDLNIIFVLILWIVILPGCVILLFRKKPIEPLPVIDAPSRGELWKFIVKDASPWDFTGGMVAKILDVKDGWVRYSIGRPYEDERMEIKYFVEIYKKVED